MLTVISPMYSSDAYLHEIRMNVGIVSTFRFDANTNMTLIQPYLGECTIYVS